MSNLTKKRKRSTLSTLMVAVITFLVLGLVGYYSNQNGVQQGREQMQSAVDQANTRMDDLTKQYTAQIDDLKKQVDVLTPPKGPDPKAPPAHDALFYSKQLKDKVEAAKSSDDRENVFWGTVCTTQRELVGVPMAVFDGVRIDTYREFVRNISPYYTELVKNKRVSFKTDSLLELSVHVQQEMEGLSCS